MHSSCRKGVDANADHLTHVPLEKSKHIEYKGQVVFSSIIADLIHQGLRGQCGRALFCPSTTAFLPSLVLILLLSSCAPSGHRAQPREEDAPLVARAAVYPRKKESITRSAKSNRRHVPTHLVRFPRFEVADEEEVRSYVRRYVDRERSFIEDCLERGGHQLELLKGIFGRYGLPPELVGIAMVESGLRPDVVSPSGTVGLWQFTKGTARTYGLRIGLFVDERKDIEKSTVAAAKYLGDLFNRFDDWYLALAAYNAGPARVSAAIEKTGEKDFFLLARRGALKRYTRDFVARVAAIIEISSNLEHYGFGKEAS